MVSFQLYFIVKEGRNEQTKDWRNRGTLTLYRTQNFAVMVFITKTIQHWEILCCLVSIFHMAFILLTHLTGIFLGSSLEFASVCSERVWSFRRPTKLLVHICKSWIPRFQWLWEQEKKRTKNICKDMHIWVFLLF